MPNIVNNTSGLSWYGKQSGGYGVDSVEAQTNATIIYNMFSQLGWTQNAVAALLGNIQAESGINPMRHEVGGIGFGLVQWTPPSNLTDILSVIYPEGYTDTDGTQQVNAVIAEYQQTSYAQGSPGGVNRGVNRQWYNSSGKNYGFNLTAMNWYDWAHSVLDLQTLTQLFMVSYERPAYDPSVNHWQTRVENAGIWYQFLTGIPPTPGPSTISRGLKVWAMVKPKRRYL